MKKPNRIDLIVLALAIAIGFGVCWFFFRPQPIETTTDNTELIQRLNDIEAEVQDNAKLFNEAAKRMDSFEVKLSKQYEKLDTLTIAGVDADLADFKLRADHKPPRRFN